MIRDSVYPAGWFGPIGEVVCCICETRLDIEDSDTHETIDGYMCDECFKEMEEEDE